LDRSIASMLRQRQQSMERVISAKLVMPGLVPGIHV
jgi:hypothetical protein